MPATTRRQTSSDDSVQSCIRLSSTPPVLPMSTSLASTKALVSSRAPWAVIRRYAHQGSSKAHSKPNAQSGSLEAVTSAVKSYLRAAKTNQKTRIKDLYKHYDTLKRDPELASKEYKTRIEFIEKLFTRKDACSDRVTIRMRKAISLALMYRMQCNHTAIIEHRHAAAAAGVKGQIVPPRILKLRLTALQTEKALFVLHWKLQTWYGQVEAVKLLESSGGGQIDLESTSFEVRPSAVESRLPSCHPPSAVVRPLVRWMTNILSSAVASWEAMTLLRLRVLMNATREHGLGYLATSWWYRFGDGPSRSKQRLPPRVNEKWRPTKSSLRKHGMSKTPACRMPTSIDPLRGKM